MAIHKLFKVGGNLVVALPSKALLALGLDEESEVSVELTLEKKEVIIKPAETSLADIDETFARQVHEFIEQYRPALEALAR